MAQLPLAIPGGGRWTLAPPFLGWLFHVSREQARKLRDYASRAESGLNGIRQLFKDGPLQAGDP